MKKILLLLAFASFGCGPDFDMDTRFVYDVQVVDSQGDPIPNAHLGFSVDDSNDGYFGRLLADGSADANGHMRGLFPPPAENNLVISLRVTGSGPGENPLVTPYEYYELIGLKREDCANFHVPVTQVTLYSTEELTDLELLYPQDPQSAIDHFSAIGEFSNRVYTTALQGNYFTNRLRVKRNQVVTLHYFVRNIDTNVSVEHYETVQIGDEPVTHQLGS